MNRILRFKQHLCVQPAGQDAVFLIGERERILLKGRLHALVTPLVDGHRTIGEIIEALDGQASPPEVYYVLDTLHDKGWLVQASPDVDSEIAAFWESLGLDAAHATERLEATPVSVHGVGDEAPEPLIEALGGLGIRIAEEAAVAVVVASDYLHQAIEAHDRRVREACTRLFLVKPSGAVPWIGPMLRPGEGPCWVCLAARLHANRPVESFLARSGALMRPPRAALPGAIRAAAQLAAVTLARWIAAGGSGAINNHLFEMNLADLSTMSHAVARRPECPACGDRSLFAMRVRAPLALTSRPKRFTDDGGHRCIAPEETIARLEHLISPLTGVVGSVGPVPGRDHPLRPVYAATYFVPPSDESPTVDDFTRLSMGKGRTAAQSRAGALCEAIERYSAVARGDEPRIRARLGELGEAALSPLALQNYSAAQYGAREAANARIQDVRRRIPRPFDEQLTLDWIPAWSLTHGAQRFLPFGYCFLDAYAPPEERVVHLDPNGHAAGNCLEEAILQGFLELVERDAIGIWWYNRIRRPAVDLASFAQPFFDALVDHYRSLGHRLWVLDLTTDLGLPAFAALALAEKDGRFAIGFGCHGDARLGVQRALTELNQIFDPLGASPPPWDERANADSPHLFPDDRQPPRRQRDFSGFAHDDLRDDVLACVKRAANAGLETIVVDQTRPDIGLSVVKVVVPGLRHIWPRFGPGRLYDVPVRMGWRDTAHAEAELNPVHLFL